MLHFTQIFERLRIVQIPAGPLIHWKTVAETSKLVSTLLKMTAFTPMVEELPIPDEQHIIMECWTQAKNLQLPKHKTSITLVGKAVREWGVEMEVLSSKRHQHDMHVSI